MKIFFIIIFVLFSYASFSETILCSFKNNDGKTIVRSFERQKHYFYVQDEDDLKFGARGFKLIFEQDDIITLAWGSQSVSEICTISNVDNIFDCTKLELNKFYPIRKIAGECN
tara:strand:- start:134 stop:472 length:339 start_codon:yes stop_codon:yes gene_type:complete